MDNHEYLKQVGSKIRTARCKHKLSLPQLSELCGLSRSNICDIELGKKNPHLLTLVAIADVFNMDVKEFL